MLNKIQELNLKLMELSSYNNFDGKRCVKDLKQNQTLWDAVLMDRENYYKGGIDLIKLRDLKDNYWNVDTIFILCPIGKENDLLNLVNNWGADEVDFLSLEDSKNFLGSSGEQRRVLRIWFD